MNIRWKVRLARISAEHSEVFGSSHWKKKRGAMGFAFGKTLGCRDTDHNHVVKEHGDRLRLSVVHELGHLVMHRVLSGKSQKEVESEEFQYGAESPVPVAVEGSTS